MSYNDGTGNFSDPSFLAVDFALSVAGVIVADLDNDGVLDIMVTGWDLNYFHNHGSTTNPVFEGYETVKHFSEDAINGNKGAAYDWDCDGDVDLVIPNGNTPGIWY